MCENVDWIHLAQNKVQCKDVVNRVNENMGSIKSIKLPGKLRNC
jgi:hypothetical protein